MPAPQCPLTTYRDTTPTSTLLQGTLPLLPLLTTLLYQETANSDLKPETLPTWALLALSFNLFQDSLETPFCQIPGIYLSAEAWKEFLGKSQTLGKVNKQLSFFYLRCGS